MDYSLVFLPLPASLLRSLHTDTNLTIPSLSQHRCVKFELPEPTSKMVQLAMLNQRKRPPSNRWNTDQRVVVCLLRRFYQKDNEAFADIFNAIFERQVRECGFTSGIPCDRLNTQWDSMRYYGYVEWSDVHVQTPFDRNGVWASMLQQIESTASELGISLVKKEKDDIDSSNFTLSATRLSTRDLRAAPSTDASPSTVSAAENQPESSDESARDDQLASVNAETQRTERVEAESLGRSIGADASPSTVSVADNQPEPRDESARVDQLSSVHVLSQQTERLDAEFPTDDETDLGRTRICAGQPCILCHEGGHEEGLQNTSDRAIPRPTTQDDQSPDALDQVSWEFTGDEFPSLLYRWWNADSMGINSKQYLLAGLFAPDIKIKYPSEYSQEEFKSLVLRHIRIEHLPTPFISTFITPLSPIHRAFKTREGAMITIIDPSKLETPLSWAKRLVFNLGLRNGRYCGVGEYLVWAKVPSRAIVASFKISDLERVADNDYEIGEILQIDRIQKSRRCDEKLRRALSTGPGRFDHRSGFTVGRLLKKLAIPQPHSEAVSKNIARSWGFSKSGTWEAFRDGLNAAYATSEASSSVPRPGGHDSAETVDSDIEEHDMVDVEFPRPSGHGAAETVDSDIDDWDMVDVE